MKRQIIKGLAALCAGVMTLCATSFFSSCERLDVLDGQVEELEGNIKDLQGQIDALDARLKAVEALKAQLETLGQRITALEAVELKFQESSSTHELQYSLDGGKTYIGTGIILTQVPELEFQVTANNELQVKYDGGQWETITTLAKNCEKNVTLRVNPDTNELEIAMDGTTYAGTGIILAENCDNEFKFQVNAQTNEVEFSFDGGKTWIPTGDKCVDPCAKPEVSFEETDEAITVYVGEESFVITKPQQIEFEIKSGKLQMDPKATISVAIKTAGIDDVTVISAPKGWYAEVNQDGKLVITAPAAEDLPAEEDPGYGPLSTKAAGDAVKNGLVKIHACAADGACMVGKLSVEVFVNPYAGTEYEDLFVANKINVNGGEFMIPFGAYYGISTPENYRDDINAFIEGMKYYQEWYEFPEGMEEPLFTYAMEDYEQIPDVEYGKEYVIWAVPQEDSWTCTYEDFYIVFHKPILMTVVEDTEAAKTAFDINLKIDFAGGVSYQYAILTPQAGMEQEEIDYMVKMYKQMLVNDVVSDWFMETNRMFESYQGPLTSMAYASILPNSDVYFYVIVNDGRSAGEYTVEDVKEFKFKTPEITAGGTIVPTITQNLEATTFSEIYATIDVEEDWVAIYADWLTEDEIEANEEDIVARLLNNQSVYVNGENYMNNYFCRDLSAGDTRYLVAFVVGADNKYGELIFSDVMSTKTIEWSTVTDFEIVDSNATVTDGTNVVTGKTLDLTLSEGVTKVKYFSTTKGSTWNYYDYSEWTLAQWASNLHTEHSDIKYYMKSVEGNTISITNRSFNTYVVFILPYDADGKPVGEAIEYNYKMVEAPAAE